MKLTVVWYLDRFLNAERSLASLQKNNCFKNLELIVVDPYCNEDSAAVLQGISGAIVQPMPGATVAQAYNYGLDVASGMYIHFTLASSILSKGALDGVLSYLSSDTVPLLNIAAEGVSTVNNIVTPVSYGMQANQSGCYDVRVETDKLNLILQTYFISSTLAASLRFDESLGSTAVHAYLLNLLYLESKVTTRTEYQYTYYELLENSATACETARDVLWYTDSLERFYIPFLQELKALNGTAPIYLQIATLYLVWAKYNCNYFDRDREALSREEAFAFDEKTCEFLSYINNNVIFQNYPCNYTMARYLKMHFYKGKCKFLGVEPCSATVVPTGLYEDQLVLNDTFYRNYSEELLVAVSERRDVLDLTTLGQTMNQDVSIRIVDYINGALELDFEFNSYLLETSDFELYVKIGEDTYLTPKPTQVYSFNKYFGITISRKRTYHLSVPVEQLLGRSLSFGFTLDGKEYPVSIDFPKVYSRLVKSNAAYVMLGSDKFLGYKDNTLYVGSMNPLKHVGYELRFFFYRLLTTPLPMSLRLKYLFVRCLYWLLYPVLHKKHIWITFDKLYKAGDDGEYMFRYCMEQEDGIDVYYVVSPAAADYPRLKEKYGRHVLKQDSLKLKLYALYAECILATHATVMNYLGYTPKTQVFIRDLFRGVIVCIQHGLTIQKIAQYQNRWFDDTRLYTLASKYEKQNVETPIYDYFGPELKMTGLARYDGLKSNDQKQILITPTWRRNIVNQSIAFVKKTHNDSFKNSEYFRIYNSLINDPDLIACAKRTGYKLIYLLHPAMSSQAEDFDRNDYVDIVQATGDMSYEKILTESSLMVTDYSGVQFDFAYQRKPLVYYHPDTLPPHYEAGGLIYDTMGFGPICKNHEQVVSTLCAYMEQGCKMEEEYVKRADDFFYYDDFHSCERIYKEVRAFLDDPKNF